MIGKRQIIFLSILMCCAVNSYAQQFGGGFFAGIAASQVSGDRLSGFNKPGPHLGLFTFYNLSATSSLQLELSFIQKGSRDNAHPDKYDFESYLLRLNYVEMPLYFRLKAAKSFYLEAGPYFGYLMGYREQDQYGDMPGQIEFEKADVGVAGGIHYIVNDNINVVFRGSNSVLPVREHKGGGSYRLNRGQYNSVISLTIHYFFRSESEQP